MKTFLLNSVLILALVPSILSAKKKTREEVLAQFNKYLDKDKDGKCTKEEWESTAKKKGFKDLAKAFEKTFKKWDKNGDGILTPEEYADGKMSSSSHSKSKDKSKTRHSKDKSKTKEKSE